MTLQPPLSTLFPYTTLFRSVVRRDVHEQRRLQLVHVIQRRALDVLLALLERQAADPLLGREARLVPRSEEHTSELQSRLHLVCRLLLEKKKRDDKMYQFDCI